MADFNKADEGNRFTLVDPNPHLGPWSRLNEAFVFRVVDGNATAQGAMEDGTTVGFNASDWHRLVPESAPATPAVPALTLCSCTHAFLTDHWLHVRRSNPLQAQPLERP